MSESNPGLMTIFTEALARPDPAERAAYLDSACGGDAELRRRVEELLAAHPGMGRFLEPDSAAVPEAPSPLSPDATGPDLSSEATGPLVSPPPVEAASGLSVGTMIAGRYRLVEIIGEGGMGSVYLAEQTEPVKRQVALKLIKSGTDSKAVLARFDAERQALALMDHPNIARVYDGGTTGGEPGGVSPGRPFFVMELVKGVPLTEFCDKQRLPIRARLELFVQVCQAVQHAHQKGIIHRDLKPGNVLVTEVDGRPTPKVIDFGVAKATEVRLTDLSYADTGAIVGTPAYMSPEQADPSSMDIDTRTDVYALGVMLYELLVGSPPLDARQFKRGAILEMLRMVREVDPPRPSTKLSAAEDLPNIAANRDIEPAKLAKSLRGELDWVVMKALEKDRTRRYDTANGLARDLQRYLADEVVEARPPSRGYRLRKFVRRHKGQVIAASLVLLVLLAGIAGTTWGLIVARDEAAEKEKARSAEAARVKQLDAANGQLAQANDELLTVAATGLLSPLALQFPNQQLSPLQDQEVESFWQLAATKDERLRLRFVEVALADPVSTRRLTNRAAIAFQADVGLDTRRRIVIEELLGRRLLAGEISPEEQVQMALCLANVGVRDRRLAGKAAEAFVQAMSKTTDPTALQNLAQGLLAVVTYLEPKERSQMCALAASPFSQAMSKTADFNALDSLRRGLSAVTARLEPKEAAEVASSLIEAMSKTAGLSSQYLTAAVSALAARLEPKEAAQLFAQAASLLTQEMRKTHDMSGFDEPVALRDEALALSVVAARLEPKEAAQVCAQAAAILIEAMSKTTDRDALQALAGNLSLAGILTAHDLSAPGGLSAVATRLEPKDAVQTAATLIKVMSKTTHWNTLSYLAQSLSVVATRLEPAEAAQVCAQAAATLSQAMSRTTEVNAVRSLAVGLSAVAARMEPKEAAATLSQAMSKITDPTALGSLARGLSAVAARVEPNEAAATLTQAMSKATHPFVLQSLAEGLSAVAVRLKPKEAAATLSQAMNKTTDPLALGSLAQALSAVAARLEPKEAAQVCAQVCPQAAATLTQAIKNPNPLVSQALARGLSAVAAWLEPKEAAEAAAILTQAMNKTTDPRALQSLAQTLRAVAARLDPKAATEAAAILTQAMSRTTAPIALQSLAEAVSALAARLEPKEAAKVCAQAASALSQAAGKPDSFGPFMLSTEKALSAVVARLEPKEAAQVCALAAAILTQAMSKTTEPDALLAQAQALSAVAACLEPKEAAQVCAQAASTLSQAMSKTTDSAVLWSLAQALRAVAARLESKEAAEVASVLSQAMKKTTDPRALQSLAQALSAVAVRLEAKEAAQVCALAAAILTQAMSKTTDLNGLNLLADGLLSAVVTRLEPKEAAEAAATLTQAMSKVTHPDVFWRLAQCLSAALAHEDSTTARPRALSVTSTVAGLHGPGLPFAVLPAVQSALEHLPPPLPPQTLVDLLKHPFCVGEARRLVLDQLSRHYHRPFADQWDFVDYVQQQKLALDLITPPARPKMQP